MKKELQRRSKLRWEEKEELRQRPTQGWEDAEKISWKKVAHRPIVILTLYCVRRLHVQLKQVHVFLERSEAKGLEERVFYLLFLLMFICYLPARTCFCLLFFYWLFALCLFYFLFLLLVICYLPGWTCRARRHQSASASRPPWPAGWPRNSTPARVTSLQ